MENNLMKVIYKHFGKEKEEGQAMLSLANIFYEMGSESNEKCNEKKEEGASIERIWNIPKGI